MEPVGALALSGKLVFSGFCLALGFWAAKRLTNRIDTFIYLNSAEYKKQVATLMAN